MILPTDVSRWILESAPTFFYIVTFLGATAVLTKVVEILLGIYKLFFRKRIDLRQRYGDNTWALVTGGSQGIGFQLAAQLAKSGLNILLLARTESKLKQAQSDLQAQYPQIKVQYLIADMSKIGQEQSISSVLPQLDKYDISIVVNNAGVDKLATYLNHSLSEVFNMININALAVCAVTFKFVKLFQQKYKEKGKKCAIINVASISGGQIPMALFSIYCATKAYVSKLTANLSYENPQIDFLILNPSEVSTAMTCHKNLDIFTITPAACAEGTINDLGQDLVTNGHISHKIQAFIYSLFSTGFFNFVWIKVFAPEQMAHREKFMQQTQNK